MANIFDMGRDLCPRHDAFGHMECHECSVVLCQTFTDAIRVAPNNRYCDECCWRIPWETKLGQCTAESTAVLDIRSDDFIFFKKIIF